MTADHSILTPSNAHQWVRCPGSVQMNLLSPPKPAALASKEGTVVAQIAAEMVQGITRAQLPGQMSSALMDTVRGDVLITKEMTDAALLYAKYTAPLIRYARVFDGPNISIERRVGISYVNPLCFGTPDFWLYDTYEQTLHVIDLKYGHRVVEAFENWQLLTYAAGLIKDKGLALGKIFLTIVQPRAPHRKGPIRTWTIDDPETLEPYFQKLQNAATLALAPNAHTRTGPHCRDCPSLLSCEAARRAELNAVDVIGDLATCDTPDNHVWYELFILKRAQEAAKHRISALETVIESKLRAGDRVARFRMVDKMSRAQWSIPYEQGVELGKTYNVEMSKNQLITPNQATKAGMPAEIVEAFSKKTKTGVKLEFNDLKEARYIFGADKKESNE